MGTFASLNIAGGALSCDLQPLQQSTSPTEPLSVAHAVWTSLLSLSPSLPYVTFATFAQASPFLSANQAILAARHFEVKGAGKRYS